MGGLSLQRMAELELFPHRLFMDLTPAFHSITEFWIR